MKSKSDIVQVFPDFIFFIKNQYGASVKALRTDNAPELCDEILKRFYADKGIFHLKTCAYTPQQNGTVERKHRHILDTSKLPLQFWGECIPCAVHLINRMPLQSLQFISPYEKFFGTSPDLSFLRVFGCLCYVSNVKPSKHKFDARANPHVFIGFPVGNKGFKVLNINTLLVTVSRNIVFMNNIFPFM